MEKEGDAATAFSWQRSVIRDLPGDGRRGRRKEETGAPGLRRDGCEEAKGRGGRVGSVGRGRGSGKCTPTRGGGRRRGRGWRARESEKVEVMKGGEACAKVHTVEENVRVSDRGRSKQKVVQKESGSSNRETDDTRSRDSSLERLGRYLSATLNVEFDSGDENYGFMSDEDDDEPRVGSSVVARQAECSHVQQEPGAGVTHRVKSEVVDSGREGSFMNTDGMVDFGLLDDASGQSGDGAAQFGGARHFSSVSMENPLHGEEMMEGGGLPCEGEREVQVESEDDGWNSDSSELASYLPSHSGI